MGSSRQSVEWRWKAAVLRLCCSGALVGSLHAGSACAADSSSARPDETTAVTPARPALAFHDFWRDLASLREAELSLRADELWRTEPRLTLRAMILRLGREIPATVTAARRLERLAIRRAARDWLAARLAAGPQERALWEEEVEALLADSSQVILWCATARALGRLGEYGHSQALAEGLEMRDPQLAQAARLALFDLYLRWFEDREKFEAFWPEAQQTCQESILMETARRMEQEARESLVQLLEYEPQRAAPLLTHPDPRLRAAAATAIGGARNGETEAAVETLLGHLEVEINGAAFQATIDALLQTQGAAPVYSPDRGRLRSILIRRLDQGYVELRAPLADALRRLKWTEAEAGEDSLLTGLALLAREVRQLSGPPELTDRDGVVAALVSLQSLATRAQKAGLPVKEHLAALRPLVLAMVEDQREADIVRIAAAQFLPLVGEPESLRRAALVLGAETTPSNLRYNLLASVGDMAAELAPGDPTAELALETLLVHLQGEDTNLRRRALSYLRTEKLAPLVGHADPSAFVASLGRESVPELQSQLLEMIASFGGPSQVAGLIALPNFDAIAAGGPAGVTSLAQTLKRLSDGDGGRLVPGAERLLAVREEGSRVLRLREALGLVASLSDASLGALTPRQHHDIVLWATELREAAGSLPGGQGFLARLNLHHLPACQADAQDPSKLEHVRALFLSDLIALDPAAGTAVDVLVHFDAALALAAQHQDRLRRALVLRDRARFGFQAGRKAAALADYRALFDSELPATPVEAGALGSRSGVLEQGDLRRGAGLVAGEPADTPESRARAAEALRISFVLVQDPIWKLEPAAVRAQDLRELAERALRAGEVQAIERVAALFAQVPDLPELPPATEPPAPESTPPVLPPAPEGALWAGLLGTREQHAALVDLRDRLRAARDSLRGPAPVAELPSTEPLVDEATDDPPAAGAGHSPPQGADTGGPKDTLESKKTPSGVDLDGR